MKENQLTVYTALPMAGREKREVLQANYDVMLELARAGMAPVTPLEMSVKPAGEGQYKALNENRGKEILRWCLFQVSEADALLMDLRGAKQVSIGCIFELCGALRKAPLDRIIAVVMEDGNPHDHDFIRYSLQDKNGQDLPGCKLCKTMSEAVEFLKGYKKE